MSIVHIKDTEEFNKKLEDLAELATLIVVDFYADWCGPCKMIAPKLEELAKEFAGAICVLKVNVDECSDLTNEYNISSMPTFVFIKNKKQIFQFSGANYEKLRNAILENK